MKQVASLRYEVIFKKAFSQLDVFREFVKDCTGVELDIERVETEKRFDPPIGRVDSRFDLFAEDKTNRVIVDIQHVRFGDHYDRFLHYHCAALLEQIGDAKAYRPPLTVLTLVILTSGDRHKVDIATIDFDPRDRHGQPLEEIFHRIIYLCPPYVNEDTPEPYREWLLAIQDSLDGEVDETRYQKTIIHKIFQTIERDGLTPQDRARMKDEYSYEEIGRDQFEKGMEQGTAAVIQALRLLNTSMDPHQIARVTGLAAEKVAALHIVSQQAAE